MRRFATPALIAVAVLALAIWPMASRGSAEPNADRTVVAAFFSSNFCTACRILDPRVSDVLPEYADTSLQFVKLDQTLSMVRSGALREQAAAHGISDVYAQLKGRTGFVALIDPRDQQVIEIVTIRYDRDHIREAFDRALLTVATREVS